jgi:O-antigen ligase
MTEQNGRAPEWLFFFFAAALMYGIFFQGVAVSQATMEDRRYRDIFLVAIGVLGTIGGLTNARPSVVDRAQRTFGLCACLEARSREDRIILWTAIALPCYALFQLLPLPVGLVGILSPARGELLRALEPLYGKRAFASLSIAPASTLTHFLLISAYCVIFFAMRKFAKGARGRAWILVSPLVVAAAVEAAMGLAQFFSGGDAPARGTYAIRNHLAGLLEMVLPFAVAYTVAALTPGLVRERGGNTTIPRVFAGSAVTVLLLAGALCTLSRGGLASILASALVIPAMAISRQMSTGRRLYILAAFCVFAAIALFFVTPMSLVARLAEHDSEGRFSIWRESIGVIREFPLTGCGLGAFDAAFLKFKTIMGLTTVDYAHNDYLQFLAELGVAGFLIGAVLFGAVARRVTRIAGERSEVRWLGLACVGSLTAILVHSIVDFNLYTPANAAVLAWICGLGAGLTPSDSSRGGRDFMEAASVSRHRSTRSR